MPGRKVPEAERRDQLLRAAAAVAVRHGLDAVTARAVAAEAGTSPGLVFFHFGSTGGLLHELLAALLAGALDADLTPHLVAQPTATARLLAAVQVELDGVPEQREAVEVVLSAWFVRDPGLRALVDDALDRYRSFFLGLCRDAVAERGGSPETADGLASAVVALVQGAALTAVRDPEAYDAAALGRALQGLLTAAAPARQTH